MTYSYTIRQDGAEVSLQGTNDTELRAKADRIARKSLETGKGDVEVTRIAGRGRPHLVATLSHKHHVALGEVWG